MAFTGFSLDLQERVALGVQAAIVSLCPLTETTLLGYTIPAAQVYYQDRIDPLNLQYPCVVVSLDGNEVEEDGDGLTFETDASKYPVNVRIIDRLDQYDPVRDKALKRWRKLIADYLRTLETLPGCPEVWNVWAVRKAIYAEALSGGTDYQYLTSDLLATAQATYSRLHPGEF
jgi:hypothetical protein